MQALRKRLEDKDMQIEFTDSVMQQLVDIGFDPVYGARPLKRAIQNWIENPLAEEVLSGHFIAGDTIEVSIGDNNKAAFKKVSG